MNRKSPTVLNTEEVVRVCERLKAYPRIAGRIKQLLDSMENCSGELIKADDIEMALIPEVRGLGKDMLDEWALQRAEGGKVEAESEGLRHHSKKNSIGIQP
jgi:hypothetical protein